MVKLSKTSVDEKQERRGVSFKFWVKYNGDSFLYKEDQADEFARFGEMLYSNLATKLGFSCVKVTPALNNRKKEKCEGVLVKNFLGENEKYISYEGVINENLKIRKITNYKEEIFDNHCIPFIIKNAQCFCAKYGLVMNEEEMQTELEKRTIFDWFVSQHDRNFTNIGFIIKENSFNLAPCFDNGLCLGFGQNFNTFEVISGIKRGNYLGETIIGERQVYSKIFPKTYPVVFAKKAPYTFSELGGNIFGQINEIASQKPEIKKLIEDIQSINISKEFNKINQQMMLTECENMPEDVQMASELMFAYKLKKYKTFNQTNEKVL